MSKRKVSFFADAEDLNDDSDSDDSIEGYAPRSRTERIHYIPDEKVRVAADGRIRSTISAVPTPASPAKKSRVTLNPDAPPPDSLRRDWEGD